MNTTRTCPECGKPVAPNGLRGLCPECMMKVGLAAQTGEAGTGGTQVVSPQPKPPPTLAEVARLFPQLEILGCIGCGGMGAVYKARQPRLDRFVALKILTRDREDTTRDARFVERFEREARALAKLSHPNIVALYEFGQVEGLPYFIMEYVDGLNVRQLEQARKLAPREALEIIPQICEALQFAHDEGIVHRDIKPANILLDKKGRVKIADFGIAKIMGGTPLIASDAEKLTARPGEGLTQDQVLGTPDYMAPEQVEHPQTVDHRADIYSLGVVFYEMLTGELPLGRFQPPSRKVQIDVRLDEIVLHTLEKEPERRYQHVSEVKTDLEAFGSTATPVRSSAGDRSLRIPGTKLALVESRKSQRLVNWTNVSLAWILLMLVGAAGLGLVKVIANQIGFYIKPETLGTAGVVMAFVATVVLTVAVQQALRLPADEFESPTPSAKAASETLDPECVKNARRLVRWPATGLSAIGLSYFVAAGCFFGFAHWPANWQDALGVCFVLAIIVINYVIILGASRMRKLQDYRMAVLAAIVCLVFSLPGLPLAVFPIWALMVLYRPDVRAAFNDVRRTRASEPAAPPASTSSVSVPRAGGAWKTVTVVAAVALLIIAVAVGSKLLAVYGHSQASQQQVSAGAAVRIEEILRREIQQRLAEGGWKVESLNVSVSPDLKRAECRFGRIFKNGLTEVPPPPAAIYLKPQGDGLWLVRGEYEFESLRFSVDTSAAMAAVRDAPPPMTAPATSFGPVREVTLNDMDDLRGGEALDLDSGRLLDLPKDSEKRPEGEQFQWLKEHSADVLLDNVNGRWGLLTPMDNELKLAPLPNEKWEVATERDLSQALAAEPPGLEIKQVQSWTVYILPTNAQPPLTFAFQTASGASGLLQITRFGKRPNCARLRFKLTQITAPSPSFGQVVETVLPFGAPCINHYLQFRGARVFTIGRGPDTTAAQYDEDRKRAEQAGGVDASAIKLQDGIQLVGEGCIFTQERGPRWDSTTADAVLGQLKHASWMSGVVEPRTKDFPVTYLFKTARGENGILQVLDVVEDERGYRGAGNKGYGVKLRYKTIPQNLVTPWASNLEPGAVVGQPSIGQPHPDKSAGWKTTSQFAVSAGGGTFELVAISEHCVTQWWRPNGTLLPEVWFTNRSLSIAPEPGEKVREFVFRADGFRDDAPDCIFPARLSLHPKPAEIWTHVEPYFTRSDYPPGRYYLVAMLMPQNKRVMDLHVLVGTGWETIGEGKPGDSVPVSGAEPALGGRLVFRSPVEQTNQTFEMQAVFSKENTVDLRMLAIDDQGLANEPSWYGSSDDINGTLVEAVFTGVPLPKIKAFRVQEAQYAPIRFANVCLEPEATLNRAP